MKYITVRSLLTGLGVSVVAASAFAQTSSSQPAQAVVTPPSASTAQSTPAAPMPGMVPGAGAGGTMRGNHHAGPKGAGEGGPMGQIPQAVIEQLALTASQKVQFDSAQSARRDLQAAKQSLRAEQQKAMAEQFSKDTIDPRAMMAQHKQMRTAMETRIEGVQQKWLVFWDGLTASQKTTLSNYMKSRHAAHTQKKAPVAKG